MKRSWLRHRASGRAHVESSPMLRDEFSRIRQVRSYGSCLVFVQQRSPQLGIMNERCKRLKVLVSRTAEIAPDTIPIRDILQDPGEGFIRQAFARRITSRAIE